MTTPTFTGAHRRRDWPTVTQFTHFIIGMLIGRTWMRLGCRVTVRKSRPLPWGPAVYACNHRAFLDPILAGMWSSVSLAYFARASLWDSLPSRLLLQCSNGIPVDRDNPGISSMKGAIERLREGVPVLVFPEGTRTRDGRIGRFKDGPALFARRAGVPVIPVYVHRTDRCWPRGSLLPRLCAPRIEIRYGAPMTAPPQLPPREQDAWLSRRLELWMRVQERRLLGPR